MKVNFGVKPGSYESGVTFNEVLKWNHFGTPTIPPRPVLRIASENVVEQDAAQAGSLINAYLKNMIEYTKQKRPEAEMKRLEGELLRKLGVATITEARRLIEGNGLLQSNAPATVRQKGFDQPLYVDGTLSKNLAYDIEG